MKTKIEFEVSFICTAEVPRLADGDALAHWMIHKRGTKLLKKAIQEETYKIRVLREQHNFGAYERPSG